MRSHPTGARAHGPAPARPGATDCQPSADASCGSCRDCRDRRESALRRFDAHLQQQLESIRRAAQAS